MSRLDQAANLLGQVDGGAGGGGGDVGALETSVAANLVSTFWSNTTAYVSEVMSGIIAGLSTQIGAIGDRLDQAAAIVQEVLNDEAAAQEEINAAQQLQSRIETAGNKLSMQANTVVNAKQALDRAAAYIATQIAEIKSYVQTLKGYEAQIWDYLGFEPDTSYEEIYTWFEPNAEGGSNFGMWCQETNTDPAQWATGLGELVSGIIAGISGVQAGVNDISAIAQAGGFSLDDGSGESISDEMQTVTTLAGSVSNLATYIYENCGGGGYAG